MKTKTQIAAIALITAFLIAGAGQYTNYPTSDASVIKPGNGNVAVRGDFTGELPIINDLGHIAWLRKENGIPSVMFWDGWNMTQVANESVIIEIDMNNHDQITWKSNDGIFLWNGSGGGAPFHLSESGEMPEINDLGQVTWRGPPGNNIYLWDGSETVRITDQVDSVGEPHISDNGWIAWCGLVGAQTEIFVWNGQETMRITDNAYFDTDVDINSNGALAWQGMAGVNGTSEIFSWDGSATRRITNNGYSDSSPIINDDGLVAWEADKRGGYHPDIHLWDGNGEIAISSMGSNHRPAINGNGKVVWEGTGGGNSSWEILYWDGIGTTQLTSNACDDRSATINDANQIAWASYADGIQILVMESPGGNVTVVEQKPLDSLITPTSAPFPYLMLMLGSAIGASMLLLTSLEVGKYSMLVLFMPLYTKRQEEDSESDYNRGKVHGYILANPGEHYNAIKRALNINNGSLAYHLHRLEKDGEIKSSTDGVYKRFYPKSMAIPNGGQGQLTEVQQIIFAKIHETPGISQKDIATILGLSSTTVNYHMERLVDMHLVRRERAGMRVRYYSNGMPSSKPSSESSESGNRSSGESSSPP